MKQTVLYQRQVQLKAKMTEFQGWRLPLLYADAVDEYHAVRSAAGLFDIGFLGCIELTGAGAEALLDGLFTRNVAKMAEGSAHYGFFCSEAGFLLDDAVLFRLRSEKTESRSLLFTNALNTEKILRRLREHASPDVQMSDRTAETCHLSLQGPQSIRILEAIAGSQYKKIKMRAVKEWTLLDTRVIVCRTGFTGEHGYEFIAPADKAEALWDALLTAGAGLGVMPCGLACRDTLRLEMGYALYGNDIDESRTPLEAGLGRYVDLKKDFIGRDALLNLKAQGSKQALAGFALLDNGTPKSGGSIFSENRVIGVVTSGGYSPRLREGIGLGYVTSRYAQAGQEIEIEVRDREIAAKIVELPFYKKK